MSQVCEQILKLAEYQIGEATRSAPEFDDADRRPGLGVFSRLYDRLRKRVGQER